MSRPAKLVVVPLWFLEPAARPEDQELCSSEEFISLGSRLGIRKETILFLRVLFVCQIGRSWMAIIAWLVATTPAVVLMQMIDLERRSNKRSRCLKILKRDGGVVSSERRLRQSEPDRDQSSRGCRHRYHKTRRPQSIGRDAP